jgi:hypothetical protein
MDLTKTERTAFGLKLKAMVNAAYFEETRSSPNDLSYMGVCRITSAIEVECEKTIGTFPKIIKGACHLARALRNPDKMKAKEDIRKGFGLLIVTAGGLSIIGGILSAFSIWTVVGVVLAIHTPILGPVMFVVGLGVVVTGVYATISKQDPQALSAKAHDLLIEAISSWADEDAAKAKDAIVGEELRLKASSAEVKAAQSSIFMRVITWPYRTTADFVENGPAKADKPSQNPTDDSK